MKTIILQKDYFIKAPMADIYAIITDFENVPKYFPAVAKSARYIYRDERRFKVEAETKAFLGSATFKVHMDGEWRPPHGFVSTNTSSLGIEHESFMMEEIPGGTKIHYRNEVEITSRFFQIFSFLIRHVALWYWGRAVFDKLKRMTEK